jgi:hypothetical protein
MKLTKINYVSAVFFGAIALIMYLLLGLLQWSLRDVLIAQGVVVTWKQTFVVTPIVGAVVGYLMMLIVISIYNFVAKKYPIGWEVKK